MKRSEFVALITTLCLLAMCAALTAGAIYGSWSLDNGVLNAALWAGALAAFGQTLVAALAAWGLRLTRQNYELTHVPGDVQTPTAETTSSLGGFRMSYADDTHQTSGKRRRAARQDIEVETDVEVRTLETGFQRVVVLLAAVTLVVLGVVAFYITRQGFAAFKADASKGFHVPRIDPLLVTIAAFTAGGYVALLAFARVRRGMEGFGEAISGVLVLALPGIFSVSAAVFLAWGGMAYASEFAAGVVIFLLAVQAGELFVNALRSYAGVEEFDQEPVDLQATPLVPMLSSGWINGIRMLAGQSLGLGGKGQGGVIPRMMPRVLVAAAVLGVLVSMLHVVPAGDVAVLERLGRVSGYAGGSEGINANLLQPGLHITFPWPIDQLVFIPERRLSSLEIGAELKAPDALGEVKFEFWNYSHEVDNPEGRFITGDMDKETKKHDARLLASFGTVWWRVKDPGMYYLALSHSETFESTAGANNNAVTAVPMNELMVARIANHAMTMAFAQHTAEQAMVSDRAKLEFTALEYMQKDLDRLRSGIEVVSFTINDVHPPFGFPNLQLKIFGPAGAYENVVTMMETKQKTLNDGQTQANAIVVGGDSDAIQKVLEGTAIKTEKINNAKAEAVAVSGTIDGFRQFPLIARTRVLNEILSGSLRDVQKIVLGPGVRPPTLVQEGRNGMPMVPTGP